MFHDYAYTTLDDLDTRERAHRNPTAFVDTADRLIIDEAHREPDLRTILFGGFFPGVREATPEQAVVFWRSYVTTYLERDVPDIAPTMSLFDYRSVMRRVAMATGSLMEYRKVADDTNVNEKTVSRYVDALQKTYLLSVLPPASLTDTTSVRAHWKPYLCDTGLLCSLLDIRNLEEIDDTFCAHLFENMVFTTLQVLCDLWSMNMHFVHTRRTSEIHEVNFVLERRNKRIAVEAKKTGTSPLSTPNMFNGSWTKTRSMSVVS